MDLRFSLRLSPVEGSVRRREVSLVKRRTAQPPDTTKGRWSATIYRDSTSTQPIIKDVSTDLDTFLGKIAASIPEEMAANALASGDKTRLPAWGPYELSPGSSRSDVAVVAVSSLVLDYDAGDPLAVIESLIKRGYALAYYTSWSHTPSTPKYRLILPLAQPVPANLWRAFWTREVAKFPMGFDPKCKDISRIYFMACQREGFASGWSRGVPYPVDLTGLTEEAVANTSPSIGPHPPRREPTAQAQQILAILAPSGDFTSDMLDALREGSPIGSTGQWQARYSRAVGAVANQWLGFFGSPPTADDLWSVISRCLNDDHLADCWRFCNTVSLSRSKTIEYSTESRAPYGNGIPDTDTYVLVRRSRKTGYFVPAELELVRVILTTDARWKGRLAYDTLQHAATLDGEPLSDALVEAIRAWLFRVYSIERLPVGLVESAITLAAEVNRFDPVVAWLNALDPWDGVGRLDRLCTEYAGGVGEPELLSRYGRCFMIGLVARQFEPSAQADTVLTLWGPQGAGKSSFFRHLMPNRSWFSDSRMDLEDGKRVLATLGGKILCEWPELASIRKADVEAVKAFLTSQVDRYVPMYSKREVVRERRVLFCGTINPSSAIPEAGRRFQVVNVKHPIALDKIDRDLKQLWAEALHRYRGGEPWYLSKDMEALQISDATKYAVSDEWAYLVREFAASNQSHPTGWFLAELSGMALKGAQVRSKADEIRLQGVLRALGWTLTPSGRWRP